MGDIKIFSKNYKELKILIQTIRIYSRNIRMGFGIAKRVMLIMKSRKIDITKEIELPNQKSIKTLGEKENYK